MSVLFSILLAGCGGGGGSGSSTSSLPRFTSESTVSVPENRLFVLILHADGQDSITYTISGGEDSTKFSLDAQTGILTFKSAPDFEDPADSNGDNKYELNVTATDTYDNQSEQTLIVIVTNVIENPDSDNDYIPDNIEEKIGMNSSNPDQNGNGIVDGRDTEGEKGDPFFDRQWHIESLGTVTNESGVESIKGYDLGLLKLYHAYMGYNDGENIIVQVVDTGVDADHEDLKENIDLSRSYKGKNVGDDPSPTTTLINNTYDYRHGTMVAGIIAASAFNGKGVRGIAPFAKIAGSNWLENQDPTILEKVWLTNGIAISNNSWGSEFDTDTDYEETMALGTSRLRDGKGCIYLFPAGNSRNIGGNANLQYQLSNRYAITVAGLKHDNTHADYSSPGSNILVSGYSGNSTEDSPTIGTTTVMGASTAQTTWDEDISKNYTFAMNGTSAATATVSGAVALVLEACPDLTWRDVKYLIAKHAKQIDSANNSWVQNAAGHSHSIDYGFGLINAQGMINDCTTTYTNLPQERSLSVTQSFNTTIADNNTMQPFSIYIPGDITVEWVEVTIDNDSSYASDYRVELISPSDTRTTLIAETRESPSYYGNWMNGGFRLSSAAFLDESSNDGLWRVEMTDMLSGDSGTLKNIQIKIYGH